MTDKDCEDKIDVPGGMRLRVLLGILGVLAVAGVLLAVGMHLGPGVSAEGITVEAICERLTSGDQGVAEDGNGARDAKVPAPRLAEGSTLSSVEGRQALVASIWWPPLQTLLKLPLVYLAASGRPTGMPSLLLSCLFGAGVLALTRRLTDIWTDSRWGIAAALLLAVNPWFLSACLDGSSQTMVVFLALAAVYGLVEWLARERLTALVVFGLSGALTMLSGFFMSAWLIALFLVMILIQVLFRTGWRKKEAVLLTAGIPVLYAFGLWVLANWLVMRDGLYFLRCLRPAFISPASSGTVMTSGSRSVLLGVSAGAGAFAILAALLLRDRRSFYLGLCTVVCVQGVVLLDVLGCARDSSAELLTSLALGSLAVSVLIVRFAGRMGKICAVIFGLGIALVMSSLLAKPLTTRLPVDHSRIVGEVSAYVRPLSRYRKIMVCGYDSLEFLARCSNPEFVHAIDLDIETAREDHSGFALFLLVHRPTGLSAGDTIHMKYPDLYNSGGNGVLYAGDWGDWRLFEVVLPHRKLL